ncbi:recombinase family protein [Kitasatospora sp. NPDC088391]|uniref:recombinase family protein n=1 Tax=Kitasatospora sp. NPDC088391 TaxID=3364074 RepID=UPI00382B7B9A
MTSTNDAPVTPYDGCGRCLLGVRRLSRVQAATSSPARQRDLILDAAAREGGHIIGWADDWEVSGASDPFTRPKLGPWLKGRHGPYDGLAASAVDRIGRDVYEGLRLARENASAGRTLLTADHAGYWDLNDPQQEQEFTLKLFMAQGEHRSIRTRNRQEAERARREGEVAGRPAYGFMHVRLPFGGKVSHTENEPDSAVVARGFVRRLLTDETGRVTVDSEAARLTRAGVLSPADWSRVMYGKEPTGGHWNGNIIKRICLSDASLGYLTHKGKAVLGRDGHPVRIAPGLWDRQTQAALREKLTKAPKGPRAPKSELLLPNVAVCGCCTVRLYRTSTSHKSGIIPAWACKARTDGLLGSEKCPQPSAPIAEMDEFAERRFLTEFGPAEFTERVWEPGNGVAQRIADLEADRERLRADRAAGLYDDQDDAEWYRREYARMGAELREAKATPEKPAGWYSVPTGRTVASEWEKADIVGRRELLEEFAVKILLFPARGPLKREPRMQFITADEAAERLGDVLEEAPANAA